jgi:hypothetical protein
MFMIRYFTNRQLANSLDINLARWKRWSREFLPPDPLGGLQSGVARDYSIDDALTVYLGGCLVSGLNFTIPQARRILSDLEPWLTGAGVHINGTLQKCYRSDIHLQVREYLIYIYPVMTQSAEQSVFRYLIRGILEQPSNQNAHTALKMQQYIEIDLPEEGPDNGEQDNVYFKILNITSALRRFITRLKLDEKTFPVFNSAADSR